MVSHLFTEITIGGVSLKNRLTMAPLFLGYAGPGGSVSPLMLEHYRMMAASGVAMVVVETSTVDYPMGAGTDRILRMDTDDNLSGLKRLSEVIRNNGAVACQQINHVGRMLNPTYPEAPLAPSEVDIFGRKPRSLTKDEIRAIQRKYVKAAMRVKRAGFNMVELHGGTGYLLTQFLSPRTNRRTDEYGGSAENRQRFALEIIRSIREEAGDFPIGYRFIADEWLPEGLKPDAAVQYAKALEKAGIAYLSIMGGTYESFFLPEVMERMRRPGFLVDIAAMVKKHVNIPVIVAGRMNTGELAEKTIAEGSADLIGLARVLWADPEWPEKVRTGKDDQIHHCDPTCGDACMQRVMREKPAFCVRWDAEKRKRMKEMFV